MASRYHEVYEGWKRDPEGFWAEAAAEIDWIKPWDKVFDETLGGYGQWFAGAECNTCYNCLDRHVERGRPGQPAIIYDSPITGAKATYSYEETLERVNAMAAVLSDQGSEFLNPVVRELNDLFRVATKRTTPATSSTPCLTRTSLAALAVVSCSVLRAIFSGTC